MEQIADSIEGARCGPRTLAGVRFEDVEVAGKVAAGAFDNGLLVETSGPDDGVLKVMPALTTPRAELERGLGIIADAVTSVTGSTSTTGRRPRAGQRLSASFTSPSLEGTTMLVTNLNDLNDTDRDITSRPGARAAWSWPGGRGFLLPRHVIYAGTTSTFHYAKPHRGRLLRAG